MSTVSEISVKTVADQVCDRLRSELLAGNHAVGSPMREEELASRLGVSRHPIRKALQKLSLEGLLTSKPNRGVVVAPSQQEHVQGLLNPMRKQLELYALDLAIDKLTEDQRRLWQVIVRKMQRAGEDGNSQKILELDAAFHQQLLIVAGLEEMIPIWQGIHGRTRDHHQQSNAQLPNLQYVAYVHNLLVESLFSGKQAKARVDWESHLENGAFNKRAMASWLRQKNTTSTKIEARS
jgi:DNA-binding GntR family transcriptional regulator